MVVALDGPAGAGKSTVARRVAAELGATFLDTGAMYRCVALARLASEGRLDDPRALDITFDGEQVLLAGEDVTGRIRSPEVTAMASEVSAEPVVREALVAKQRELLAGPGDWVAEGRDVGTVVAPHAELKVFLTADPRERARRRAEQAGRTDVEAVLAEQVERDARDEQREHSPLVAAEDAVHVDSTGLSLDEVVDRIVALANERRGPS